ncbi:18685_t:CDS:2 [Gigaspora margarita]|uniref:18685_t:CDS:1 n=1 Tax=Gigaspora margarita TaxID=4874 RepID=A0ABN7V116_GIGMA|nr:18685_t:CDS:2 [Gigaspora margarita]
MLQNHCSKFINVQEIKNLKASTQFSPISKPLASSITDLLS